ncbi:MAG: aspartate--tRNA ligase, partial [Clostridia bacterium]|nr:aspartate--tRNA ligase [Clostridia bacterium]
EISLILDKMKGEVGDLLLFVADKSPVTAESLGNLRRRLAEQMNLIPHDELKFTWVTEFPLVNYNEEEGRWESEHHPFTSPSQKDLGILEEKPGRVRARAYDLILNGTEIGGGSIRIHNRRIQERVFSLIGLTKEEIEDKFGFMLEAFEYGVPPHGGIAFGLDRLVMIMAGKESIRDCIAFPKTQSATCLMTEAPSSISGDQLKELGIQLKTRKRDS